MKKFLISINCLEHKIKVFNKTTNNLGSIIYIYNKNRILKTFINKNVLIRWDESTKHLTLHHYSLKRCAEIIMYVLENLLFSMNRLWFTKISFKGKGFKIKKRRRTKSIKFFFYHSHVNTIILKKAKLKQKKKK